MENVEDENSMQVEEEPRDPATAREGEEEDVDDGDGGSAAWDEDVDEDDDELMNDPVVADGRRPPDPSHVIFLDAGVAADDTVDGRIQQPPQQAPSVVEDERAVDLNYMLKTFLPSALQSRLLFVAERCPPIRQRALLALLKKIEQEGTNTSAYLDVLRRLESLHTSGEIESVPMCNTIWLSETNARQAQRLDTLMAELKRNKEEGVKESTRRALEALFQQHVATGQLGEASRLYGRGLRENTTQLQHLLSMLSAWLEVVVCEQQWSRADPIISQIERACQDFEQSELAAKGGPQLMRGHPSSSAAREATRAHKALMAHHRARANVVQALLHLSRPDYRAVTNALVQINADELWGVDVLGGAELAEQPPRWLVGGRELALYVSLCGLASFTRDEIAQSLLGPDAVVKKLLEWEPRVVSLLENYVHSQFGAFFDKLEEVKTIAQLDIYLSEHVRPLWDRIVARAQLLYLKPFVSCSLNEMAVLFRTDKKKLEDSLWKLAESGEVSIQIDSTSATVRVVPQDARQRLYKQTLYMADQLERRTQSAVMRLRLFESNIWLTPQRQADFPAQSA